MSERDQTRVFSTDAWMREIGDTVHRRLKDGDGGGTSTGMEERVAKLETHFAYVRKDLDEIKGDQKTIIAALSALPTKRDLTTNILVMVAIGLSVLAITVGGIIGGLAWLDRSVPVAAAPQPNSAPPLGK